MPELPEVETIKQGLKPLVGSQINTIVLRHTKLRLPLDYASLKLAEGQKIIAINRRAKYLILQLEFGYLLIHLGMSGKISLLAENLPILKHDHVDIVTPHYILRYNDPRRFGLVVYTNNLNSDVNLKNLGVEPLELNFNPNYLMEKIQTRKTSIKELIMDNKIVVGVGNIYASEALFLSKIRPIRPGNSLKMIEISSLVDNIKQVLNLAIKMGGSTLKDYQQADGQMGYFQNIHQVYAKKSCTICHSPITTIYLGQRNSYYCPICQK